MARQGKRYRNLIKIRIEGGLAMRLSLMQSNLKTLKPMYKQLGIQVRDYYQRAFAKRGAVDGNKKWEDLSPISALFRKGAGKMYNEDEMKARAKMLDPLMDKGILRNSMTYNADNNKAEIGTNQRGYQNQEKRHDKFNLNGDMVARFKQNVPKVLPGRKPVALTFGTIKKKKKIAPGIYKVKYEAVFTKSERQPKKNWNPFYFEMLNGFYKMSRERRTTFIPARPFIFKTNALRQIIIHTCSQYFEKWLWRKGKNG